MELEQRYWDDEKWANEHMPELQKKYVNKWVAIVNREVVGVGDNAEVALNQARAKTKVKGDILVIFVESGENLY